MAIQSVHESQIHKLSIEFNGKNETRDKFLENFNAQLIPFLSKDVMRWKEFLFFVREMVKNIYDHADGIGSLRLSKDINKRIIAFEVKDGGTETFDIPTLRRKGSSKAGSGHNFGGGLGFIIQLSEHKPLGIKLKIDTLCGFRYSGFLKF